MYGTPFEKNVSEGFPASQWKAPNCTLLRSLNIVDLDPLLLGSGCNRRGCTSGRSSARTVLHGNREMTPPLPLLLLLVITSLSRRSGSGSDNGGV